MVGSAGEAQGANSTIVMNNHDPLNQLLLVEPSSGGTGSNNNLNQVSSLRYQAIDSAAGSQPADNKSLSPQNQHLLSFEHQRISDEQRTDKLFNRIGSGNSAGHYTNTSLMSNTLNSRDLLLASSNF